MTFTVGASESENLRSLWADGKSTGIFLTIEEAASLLIYGPIVGQSAVEKMFSAFPHRVEMLRKLFLLNAQVTLSLAKVLP